MMQNLRKTQPITADKTVQSKMSRTTAESDLGAPAVTNLTQMCMTLQDEIKQVKADIAGLRNDIEHLKASSGRDSSALSTSRFQNGSAQERNRQELTTLDTEEVCL